MGSRSFCRTPIGKAEQKLLRLCIQRAMGTMRKNCKQIVGRVLLLAILTWSLARLIEIFAEITHVKDRLVSKVLQRVH